MPGNCDVCVSEGDGEKKMGKEKIKDKVEHFVCFLILLLVLLPIWGSQMCYREADASDARISVLQ